MTDEGATLGIHHITWNGKKYAPRMYLAKLESNQSTQVVKMVLMK